MLFADAVRPGGVHDCEQPEDASTSGWRSVCLCSSVTGTCDRQLTTAWSIQMLITYDTAQDHKHQADIHCDLS